MPASFVSISLEHGVEQFYCPFCAAKVFDEEDGMAEDFCGHVKVFVDWARELIIPGAMANELADQLDEIDCGDPTELSAVFGDDAIVFELIEPGRGGGHDGGSWLVVIGVGSDGGQE